MIFKEPSTHKPFEKPHIDVFNPNPTVEGLLRLRAFELETIGIAKSDQTLSSKYLAEAAELRQLTTDFELNALSKEQEEKLVTTIEGYSMILFGKKVTSQIELHDLQQIIYSLRSEFGMKTQERKITPYPMKPN